MWSSHWSFYILVTAIFCQPLQGRMIDASRALDQVMEGGGESLSSSSVATSKGGLGSKSLGSSTQVNSQIQNLVDSSAPGRFSQAKRNQKLRELLDQLSPEDKRAIPQALKDEIKRVQSRIGSAGSSPLTRSGGILADSSLNRSKSGVPRFPLYVKTKSKSQKTGKTRTIWKAVAKVPLLNVGEEEKVALESLLPDFTKVPRLRLKNPKRLKTANRIPAKTIKKWQRKIAKKIANPRKVKKSKYGLGNLVTMDKIEKSEGHFEMEDTSPLKDVVPFEKADITLLAALLLNKSGEKCHVAGGLLYQVRGHKKHKNYVNFLLGKCGYAMGLYSDAVKRLIKTIELEDSEMTPVAITTVLSDLPKEYIVSVSKVLRKLKNQKLIPKEVSDLANYTIAKGSYWNNQYSLVEGYVNVVSKESLYYLDAKFLLGVTRYSQGQLGKSIKTLSSLEKWMGENKKTDKNISSLIAINLARMYFQKRKFSLALEYFQKIHKDHPLWVDGLIEQGWAQIQQRDYAGAIGNMYSLHSPYFSSVFIPESYVVRTIGYLNICQYGDAYRTLTHLENQHRGWVKDVSKYVKDHKLAKDYYGTIAKYLSKRSKRVDGLDHQIIRELARSRKYINYQKSINEKEDEILQYSFIRKLIQKDKAKLRWRLKQTNERALALKGKIKKNKSNKALVEKVAHWKGLLRSENKRARHYRYKIKTYGQSEKGFSGYKKSVGKVIAKQKYRLREKAARTLVRSLLDLQREMNGIILNNEFLRFEIFSRSGENIRYQMAGGKAQTKSRIPAHIKPEKMVNWEFDGEYWEDEIGSYRSSLKNNCSVTTGMNGKPPSGPGSRNASITQTGE